MMHITNDNDVAGGVFEGQILCHKYSLTDNNINWAKVIYDEKKNNFGVQWIKCGDHEYEYKVGIRYWGASISGLEYKDFDNTWITTDDPKCPPCPFKEVCPLNNQGRKYCFWHKYTETKSIKVLDKTVTYCPICER